MKLVFAVVSEVLAVLTKSAVILSVLDFFAHSHALFLAEHTLHLRCWPIVYLKGQTSFIHHIWSTR